MSEGSRVCGQVISSTNQLEQRHDDNQVTKEILCVTIFDAFVAPPPLSTTRNPTSAVAA